MVVRGEPKAARNAPGFITRRHSLAQMRHQVSNASLGVSRSCPACAAASRIAAVFWLLAVVHTIQAGRDAAEWWFLLLGGALVVPAALLLTLRWLGRASDSQAPARSVATSQRAS